MSKYNIINLMFVVFSNHAKLKYSTPFYQYIWLLLPDLVSENVLPPVLLPLRIQYRLTQ